MKKVFILLFSFLLLFFLFTQPAFAAYSVPKIDIEATLREDGSMHIRQVWETDISEGTEIYVPLRDSGYLVLTNLCVSDQTKTFETLPSWDVDASFSKKAYRCGLVDTDTGYEICWGISQYGKNRFTVEYDLSGVVGAYQDADGFNFRFLNDRMNFVPTDATLVIRLESGEALTDENCDIWAFGYDGIIEFRKEGTVYCHTESPLEEEHHMTVMLRIDKGLLSPVRTVDESFEQVKDNAFDGSDYSDNGGGPNLAFLILIAGIFALSVFVVVFVLVITIRRKRELNRFYEAFGYWRETPNEGKMNATAKISRLFGFCEESAVIGAHLLRLINMGCLVPETVRDVGFFGREKKNVNMHFAKEPPSDSDPFDASLYHFLQRASGTDQILQPGEVEKFCQKDPMPLRNFINQCYIDGNLWLTNKFCFTGRSCSSLKGLTDAGKTQLGQAMGLKRYLKDFSLIGEREISESFVWQDYMVYATLFGIAEQVMKDLKKVYPQYVPELEQLETTVFYANYYRGMMYSAMLRREGEIQAQRFAGSGGRASFGGGGGFSGGGSGGGIR